MFGRTWSYITPAYFYEEMDLFDIAKLATFVPAEEYSSCWIGMKKKRNKELQDAISDGVVSRSN